MALGQQNLLQDGVLGVMAATFAILIVRSRRAHVRERKRRERRSRRRRNAHVTGRMAVTKTMLACGTVTVAWSWNEPEIYVSRWCP